MEVDTMEEAIIMEEATIMEEAIITEEDITVEDIIMEAATKMIDTITMEMAEATTIITMEKVVVVAAVKLVLQHVVHCAVAAVFVICSSDLSIETLYLLSFFISVVTILAVCVEMY